MKNTLLITALESANPIAGPGQEQESFLETVDELRDTSSEYTPDDVTYEEHRVAADSTVIDELVTQAQGIGENDAVAMEALSIALEAICGKYGITGTRASLESYGDDSKKAAFIEQAEQVKASLENALQVSQESWAVRDLWDSIGAVERNSSELDAAIKHLGDVKEWFSENGVRINSIGILQWITVNDKPTKDLGKDTQVTAKHAEGLLDAAKIAEDTADKIRNMVHGAKVENTEDALALLKKVSSLPNPSLHARQKLDGDYLLGNVHTQFNLAPNPNRTGIDIGNWDTVGKYARNNLGRLKHGIKASAMLRFPAWLLTYGVAGGVASAAGAVVGAALIIGVTSAFATTTAMNNRQAGGRIKHQIKYSEVIDSFKKTSELGRRTAAIRRGLPNQFERMFTGRDQLKVELDRLGAGLDREGKAALNSIKAIYSSAEKLHWSLNMHGFGLIRDMVNNSTSIAKKMTGAAKR